MEAVDCWETTADLAADVAAAKRLLLDCKLRPRLLRLQHEEDDGTVEFEVEGFGEFTVYLPDPYPGEMTVYGPDDFAYERDGSVKATIEATLEKLRSAKAVVKETDDTFSPEMDEACSPDVRLDMEESPMAAADVEMDPKFARDLENARRFFGGDAVECAEMVDGWRVRLTLNLEAYGWPNVGQPLITWMAAEAWGIDAELPLLVELHIPKEGYLTGTMSPNCIMSVTQPGYDGFQMEQQMKVLLSGFCSVVLGHEISKTPALTRQGKDIFNAKQWDMIREWEEKKAIMMSVAQADVYAGFLVHLMLYAQARLAKMNEYCALCDEPFGLNPMLMRTVCMRPLCTHQLTAFGSKITSADKLNHNHNEVVDLLYFMLDRAVNATDDRRRELVLDPYPLVYAPGGGDDQMFEKDGEKDISALQRALDQLARLRRESNSKRSVIQMGAAWINMASDLGHAASGLLEWLVASNRTFLKPLRREERIQAFCTDYQYLLISATPEKEEKFQKLKKRHGTYFAFHGSSVGNWHSILRNGLRNASNTPLMSAGAAYGPGIYMARASPVSLQFSGLGAGGTVATPTAPELERSVSDTGARCLSDAKAILAVCEVVNNSSVKTHNNYDAPFYVAEDEDAVVTRFLLVYNHTGANVDLKGEVVDEIKQLMERMNVGVCPD